MSGNSNEITVIGAGLAGAEAAWQAAERGVKVKLIEMKPKKYTPAHHNANFAELVCSNSLRSDDTSNAVGLLKEELRMMNSLIMEAAEATRVAAGSALAVDRVKFSQYITDKIKNHQNIEIIEAEADKIDTESGNITIVATGPLTSDVLAEYIRNDLGFENLYFHDAAAPIVDASSINMDIAFYASRYGKGDADYINCPMNEEQYNRFYEALISAEEAPLKEFDREYQSSPKVFEGCMPVEVMAKRGRDTLLFGPLKPVGLENPITGENYHAVVQLRRENNDGTMFNIVGFQTHLTFSEQKRVFSLIPGLENAVFLRYGVMHRNTYLNSPGLLTPYYSLTNNRNIYFAGQITGVEGYVESASSGFVAGICAAARAREIDEPLFPKTTVIGALAHFVSEGTPLSRDFQPMNANFGIIEPLDKKVKGGKKFRNAEIARRSIETIQNLYVDTK